MKTVTVTSTEFYNMPKSSAIPELMSYQLGKAIRILKETHFGTGGKAYVYLSDGSVLDIKKSQINRLDKRGLIIRKY